MLAEGLVDDAGGGVEVAVDEGEVGLGGLPVLELAGDAPVGLVGFADDHDAGGELVESVDDAWAAFGGADVGEAFDGDGRAVVFA